MSLVVVCFLFRVALWLTWCGVVFVVAAVALCVGVFGCSVLCV